MSALFTICAVAAFAIGSFIGWAIVHGGAK